MNENDTRKAARRQAEIEARNSRSNFPEKDGPAFSGPDVRYEVSGRVQATEHGGIGAFHELARRSGLVGAIDEGVSVLQRHLPYRESDHVLSLAFNALCGGACLDDVERLRGDQAYLDLLGAPRVPDPTTSGDFLRRFSEGDIRDLEGAVNSVRPAMWEKFLPKAERRMAVIDADGAVAETQGECKQGMDMAYNGAWSYHVLLLSLANTQEPLFLVNRPGSRPSHEGAAGRFDEAADLVLQSFAKACFRGDTDFSQTAHLDRWDGAGHLFVFGMDARSNLVERAKILPEAAWEALKRPKKGKARRGAKRRRPENVKRRIVEARAVRVTCQVLRTGGRLVSRVLRWIQWLEEFFAGAGRVRRLRMAQ